MRLRFGHVRSLPVYGPFGAAADMRFGHGRCLKCHMVQNLEGHGVSINVPQKNTQGSGNTHVFPCFVGKQATLSMARLTWV